MIEFCYRAVGPVEDPLLGQFREFSSSDGFKRDRREGRRLTATSASETISQFIARDANVGGNPMKLQAAVRMTELESIDGEDEFMEQSWVGSSSSEEVTESQEGRFGVREDDNVPVGSGECWVLQRGDEGLQFGIHGADVRAKGKRDVNGAVWSGDDSSGTRGLREGVNSAIGIDVSPGGNRVKVQDVLG